MYILTKERHTQLVMESQKRHPEKNLARKKVTRYVKRGIIRPARELKCIDCKNTADCYDHYKGYGKEHQLDIKPVCWKCHIKRGKNRKEYKNMHSVLST